MKSPITYAELQSAPKGAILKCFECHGEFSADHRDYFLEEPSRVIHCGWCVEPITLCVKKELFT